MKKIIASLLVGIFSMTFVAGCSKSTETKDTTKEDAVISENKVEKEVEKEVEKDSGDVEYAIILKNLTSDFWNKMKEGIEAKAKELGIKVDVFAAQNEEDTEGQLKIFENAISSNKYKAIGIAPLSPVNTIPAIVEANKQGIYIMNVDEKVDMEELEKAGGSVIAFATTNNKEVGEKGAQALIEALPDGGQVAIIEGKAGNISGEDRKDGATAAFKANDKFELVASQPGDWDRSTALNLATTIINQNPDIVAFYCCNDTMALGVVQAVINAGKQDQIKVVGTDGNVEAVDAVETGELFATVGQDSALMGAISLERMIKAVADKEEIQKTGEPEVIPVDSQLIIKK